MQTPATLMTKCWLASIKCFDNLNGRILRLHFSRVRALLFFWESEELKTAKRSVVGVVAPRQSGLRSCLRLAEAIGSIHFLHIREC